jgi:DNA-binding CsgD family transcriptional regulator/tetratricopeptide (TPR) repeat protein
VISGDPLTGRDDELAFIRHAISTRGKHAGVVIVGAAGVGKTRLAREALLNAQAAGEHTHWIVGTESARALPLGAFAVSLIETMSDPPNIRRIVNSFVAQRQRGRVLIGVDDAHLLDNLSAHVVHQLAQAQGIRLVVTLRRGVTEPDAVTVLWKDGLLARLDLQPMSAEATRTMIEADLGGTVDTRSAHQLWKLTGGNALFLTQLVKDDVAAGRLRQVAGVWMRDDRPAASPSLSDMVGNEIGRLTPGVARVVDVLSQAEPLGLDVVSDVAERGDLERAETLGLVTAEREGGKLLVRLAHPLFGELRRATAGEIHLSKIRGQLAQCLARNRDSDSYSTVRRALLLLESDLPPDPQLFLEAARSAMTLLDLDLADRFARAAADAGATEATGLRAMNLAMSGRGDEAECVLSRIASDESVDRHHWATVRAANLNWMLGRPSEASAILADLAATNESQPEKDQRLAIEACVDVVSARCKSADQKARTAMASGTLTDFHAMMASVALTMSMGALGRVDELSAVGEEALRRATTSFQASPMRFWFAGVYARACRLTGRINEFVASAEKLAETARDVPGLAYANLALLLGNAALMRGDVPRAVRLLHEALAGAESRSVTSGLRAASCFALAEAHSKLGRPEEARTALARALVPDEYLYMHTGLAVATGWALAAGGSLAEAVEVVQAAAEDARDRVQPTHELACIQAAAQWGDGSAAARARELAKALSIPLANTIARHAESLLSNDGEGLLAASAQYREIGDRATAADAAAQAGVVLTRAQHRNRGLHAAAIAQELAIECGGLCTPALRSPVGVPLTGRQRDVIELVVAGLSNREIADRLVMSVRTVEGHVYRACQRVGAQTREELATIILRNPAGHG